MSTPLSFPRSKAGITDDNRKIHAKEWINTIMSSLEVIQTPITGKYVLMYVVIVVIVVSVKSW
jgi:hypothetical protein